MKHLTILSLASFLCIGNVHAQKKQLEYSIENGISFSTLRGTSIPAAHKRPVLAYTCGIAKQRIYNKTFSFKTGLFYEQKGVEIRNNMVMNGVRFFTSDTKRLDYLSMPLLLKARTGNKIIYHVEAGVWGGLLIGGYNTFNYNDSFKASHDFDALGYFDYEFFDYGITLGAGLSSQIGKHWLVSFNIRNNLGLVNISDRWRDKDDTKTNATNAYLGISYSFKSISLVKTVVQELKNIPKKK